MVREAKDFLQPGLANPNYAKWLLDAIRKIKHQKQRPSIDRIYNAVRQFHKVSRDTVEHQLELCVKEGTVLKVYNKGLCSYKDPKRVSQLKSRTLKIDKGSDLVNLIVKSVKELGEIGGSNLKDIEKYICRSYNVDLLDGVNLNQQLRLWLKKGLKSGRLMQYGRLIKVGYSSGESDSVEGSSEGGSVIPAGQLEDEMSSVRSDSSLTFATRTSKVSINNNTFLFDLLQKYLLYFVNPHNITKHYK